MQLRKVKLVEMTGTHYGEKRSVEEESSPIVKQDFVEGKMKRTIAGQHGRVTLARGKNRIGGEIKLGQTYFHEKKTARNGCGGTRVELMSAETRPAKAGQFRNEKKEKSVSLIRRRVVFLRKTMLV